MKVEALWSIGLSFQQHHVQCEGVEEQTESYHVVGSVSDCKLNCQ